MDTPVIAHIISARRNPGSHPHPLFIGLQGPQGSGKTTLSAQLKSQLSDPPYSLNVVVLSIDDLYLPHHDLVALASRIPPNPLWAGRGLPGTHDVALGIKVLEALRVQEENIELPVFDKSLFGGEGDRLPCGLVVHSPIDIVILEGWCVGFSPISEDEVGRLFDSTWRDESRKFALADLFDINNIQLVNEALKHYVDLWTFLDLFVQIRPVSLNDHIPDYSIIYKWRLEQEQNMKTGNGGLGMSDAEVKRFVDRYIPGYIFFGELGAAAAYQPRWTGKGIRLLVDEGRKLVETCVF